MKIKRKAKDIKSRNDQIVITYPIKFNRKTIINIIYNEQSTNR
jgi:hypothetical protein